MTAISLPIVSSGNRIGRSAHNGPKWPMQVDVTSLEGLRRLLDEMPDSALIVDAMGQIVIANAAARQMFGFEGMEGMPVENLLPASLREAHQVYRRVFTSMPQVRPMGKYPRLQAKRADGQLLWLQIELTPFWASAGVWTAALLRKAPGEAH